MEELRQEIEEKKLLRKPEKVPCSVGIMERLRPYELVKEIERLEKEVERKKNLLSTFENNCFDKNNSVPVFNKEDYLLPEYREGGYFASQDFYDKCDEFHKILEEHGEDFMKLSRDEYIFLKKEFFQNTYGITWLSEEEQFLPGTNIIVHAERL